jgi:hypothetical protein
MFYQDPAMLSDSVFEIAGFASGAKMAEGGMVLLQRVPIHHPTWVFIYIFALLGFYAWIRIYYGNIFIQTAQATINYQVANRMYLDNNILKNQQDRVLYVLYFLVIAFLIYFMEVRLELTPNNLTGGLLYLFNLGVLSAVFLGRIVLLNSIGFLFNRLSIFREYLYNIFIFNKLTGLMVLSLMIFFVYTKGMVQDLLFWFTLSVVGLMFIIRLFRGLIFSFKKDVLIFYMFLYLCALEIAPLVLLYRWLEGVL